MTKILVFFLILAISSVLFIRMYPQRTLRAERDRSTVRIGSQTFSVEVVATAEKITKGLGDRSSIGSDGMLFVMQKRDIPYFWMKDMQFDLDFIWIDGQKVVDITENVPAQIGASDSELRVYAPKAPVTHVLEIPAGESKKRNIAIGDAVSVPQ